MGNQLILDHNRCRKKWSLFPKDGIIIHKHATATRVHMIHEAKLLHYGENDNRDNLNFVKIMALSNSGLWLADDRNTTPRLKPKPESPSFVAVIT